MQYLPRKRRRRILQGPEESDTARLFLVPREMPGIQPQTRNAQAADPGRSDAKWRKPMKTYEKKTYLTFKIRLFMVFYMFIPFKLGLFKAFAGF
jgi:hypothetical protein